MKKILWTSVAVVLLAVWVALSAATLRADNANAVSMGGTGWMYFGDAGVDGTWRLGPLDGELTSQKRVAGIYEDTPIEPQQRIEISSELGNMIAIIWSGTGEWDSMAVGRRDDCTDPLTGWPTTRSSAPATPGTDPIIPWPRPGSPPGDPNDQD